MILFVYLLKLTLLQFEFGAEINTVKKSVAGVCTINQFTTRVLQIERLPDNP